MPAARKVSALQMELLISYMEEHRALATGQSIDTPQAKAAVRQQWEELAATLNAIMGHQKTGTQWRDYWRDIKYRVKRKAGAQDAYRRGTGGGPPSTEVLTSVEERIFAIMGRLAVLGDEEVRIPFNEEVPLPALPSLPPLGVKVVVCSPAVDAPAPLVLPAPLPRPPASQPSTSRAPPVEGPPSAAAEDAPARASKRKRRADATAMSAANPAEIPQPRWAWEAEQNRLALDQRRLETEERSVALFERAVQLFESSVATQEAAAATLVQINEKLEVIMNHLVDHS